ncbi:hypothetical protein [Pontibacter mucosus]|uniref:hypothetical protein n=1 Tax=Pontibacter mucosus TaxID=1649266 RepID=UPI0011B1FC12|nr:hypothetical protein [Pontibacter mucosus]
MQLDWFEKPYLYFGYTLYLIHTAVPDILVWGEGCCRLPSPRVLYFILELYFYTCRFILAGLYFPSHGFPQLDISYTSKLPFILQTYIPTVAFPTLVLSSPRGLVLGHRAVYISFAPGVAMP